MPSNTMREAEFDVSPIRAAGRGDSAPPAHTHHRGAAAAAAAAACRPRPLVAGRFVSA
jgi:hypothetical protein